MKDKQSRGISEEEENDTNPSLKGQHRGANEQTQKMKHKWQNLCK